MIQPHHLLVGPVQVIGDVGYLLAELRAGSAEVAVETLELTHRGYI